MSKQSFLNHVANHILRTHQSLTHIAVVLPNQRAGLFLKKEFSEIIDQPVFLPDLLTIEEFFYRLSGLTKVEQTEQLFRLYKSHQKVAQSPDSFDQFLSWAPTFLSDCGELDTNLIPIHEFFTTLYRDREIRNWNVGDELTELQEQYLNFWKDAEPLYTEFTTELLNDGKAYNGLSYRYAIDHLEQSFRHVGYEQVYFVGFNALNRAEEALFDFVYKNKLGSFYWDTDDYYVSDEENKAGQYFREYAEHWPSDASLQKAPKQIGINTESIEIIEAPDNISQCAIASQLLEEYGEQHALDANTAIVLADEQLLEPLLFQLPKDEMTYNITMGKALIQFPLLLFFDDYFAFQQSIIKEEAGVAYPVASMKTLLTSPFLRMLEQEPHSQQLLDELIENNMSILWKADFDTMVSENCSWKSFFDQKESTEQVLQSTHQLIELLRSHFLSEDDPLRIQVLFEFKKILQQFESYIHLLNHDLSLTAFRQLVKQVARSTRIPYEGEPLKGLQIMGVLETRCLDFERLIVVSANEGILPKGQSGTSFIPYIFKEHFQIQTFKDKDAIYAYTFYRLLHQAKEVTYIYNGQPGKLGGGEVSRFVQQIEAEFPEKVEQHVPVKSTSAAYSVQPVNYQEYTIQKDEELLEKIVQYIETKGLSPSSIKQLVNAPLDFYFQRIVGIKEPRELEENIETDTFGSIVHNSLEELYRPLIGEQLSEEQLNDLKTQITDEVDRQIKKVFKKGDTNTGINLLYRQAATTLVEQTIDTDIHRIKSNTIQLLYVEEDLSCTLTVDVLGRTIPVRLHGKADRIQYRNESLEVIDYKTGSVDNLKSRHVKKIHEDPKYEKLHQLLCYSLMLYKGEQSIPLQTIRPAMQALKSWQSGLSYIDDNPNFIITDELMDEYISQLKTIIQQLVDPSLPFTAETDEKRLKWSAYRSIYL